MKVNCQNEKCGYEINIPDNKLPNRPVKIACPECKSANLIKPQAVSGNSAAGTNPQAGLEAKIMGALEQRLAAFRREILAGVGAGAVQGLFAPESSAVLAEGIRKALICDDDAMIRQVIKDSVAKLGYQSDGAPTIEGSLDILSHVEIGYSLILIDKVFPDDSEGGYKILSKVATLPLDVRRKIFVVFISGDMKSGDANAAFLMGANTVVNKKDLNRLSAILKEEMDEYERLYRVFNKCLHMSKTYSH
ncbi:MAG: response regulator [bacterium]|nr:response regulator [bacterium]